MNNPISSNVLLLLLTLVSAAVIADDDARRAPLRGQWSFSQIVPSTTLLTGEPVPLTAVGTVAIDAHNHFSGHGVFNIPVPNFTEVPGLQAIELDLNGSCSPRDGDISNGLDCLFNFPEFGLADIGRYCVPMDRKPGRCIDEMRCVNINEPGETVALIEFRRQRAGTCR